jgi:hypothetical protein
MGVGSRVSLQSMYADPTSPNHYTDPVKVALRTVVLEVGHLSLFAGTRD